MNKLSLANDKCIRWDKWLQDSKKQRKLPDCCKGTNTFYCIQCEQKDVQEAHNVLSRRVV